MADAPFDVPALPRHPLLDGAVARPCGEAAVTVEFGDAIDPAHQARARALAAALAAAAPPGLVEALATYRSTLVEFDPAQTSAERVLAALPPGTAGARVPAPREWIVPVCLDHAVAEDADEAAALLSVRATQLRARLLASTLTVGMYGFAPGFAYLSGLDPALHVPRRAAPRPPVAPGTLIIAAGQAAIVPASMPTGWYAVGRSPVTVFDPARTDRGEAPVPFAPGDRVRFERIDPGALDALRRERSGGLREGP